MDQGSDLRERIQRKYPTLRRSEQRVADYLVQVEGQRLDHSITDFARLIGVSEATVSRVSKALGFNGYPDMKLSIAAASQPRFENLPADLDWTDTPSEISRKLSSVLSTSLFETEKLVDGHRLEEAVQAILDADRVVFIGVGGAAAICEEAAHLFLKIGIDATHYNDGYTQTVVASTLKPGNLLFGVSHTGTTPTVVSAISLARSKGIKTIAITGDATSALAASAELVFTTTQRATRAIPLYGDFLEGRICQLFLVDVLYINVMFRLDSVARDALATTTNALAENFGTALPATAAQAKKPRRSRAQNGA